MSASNYLASRAQKQNYHYGGNIKNNKTNELEEAVDNDIDQNLPTIESLSDSESDELINTKKGYESDTESDLSEDSDNLPDDESDEDSVDSYDQSDDDEASEDVALKKHYRDEAVKQSINKLAGDQENHAEKTFTKMYNLKSNNISRTKADDNKEQKEIITQQGDDETEEDLVLKDETMELMKKNYSHPEPSDPNIQYKLYKKREYYYNKIPHRPKIAADTEYSIIKDYRDNTCARPFTLHEHQGMLSNLINPDTPYKGIIVFHGLGSGKCVHKSTSININGSTHDIENIWDMYKTTTIQDAENGYWSKPKSVLMIDSYDQCIGKIVKKRILNLYREKINSHLRVIILDTESQIIITDAHKLLTNNGWTNDLYVGDLVMMTATQTIPNRINQTEFVRIKQITRIDCDDYVYDFEIQDTHNYVANGIVCHNTCVGIAIAEKFKPMVQKYNTKIYVLVPGPIIKESWRKELLMCTGETYKKYQDKYTYVDAAEKNRQNKQAIAQALQYYRIMSYRSFYKRVLGEKIVDKKVTKGARTKTTYRKTKEGDFERDIAVDRIYNLNNTVIIVDEAHNLTGNAYGKALEKIIHNSINLKTVLMSATLMKNLGSDIIELVNFLRPKDLPMERDKIFNSHKNHLMDFKQGGLEYFKNMINGYISHVRGSDPLTFAKRVDKGEVPDGLLFTKVIRCEMMRFQRETYDSTVKDFDDALDRASEAVANMSFPGLSKDRKSLTGYYGREGLNIVKEQLKVSSDLLNKKIGDTFFEGKEDSELMYITQDGKTITGKIYKAPYLKNFSVKFYKTLKKVSRLVAGKKGAQTAFVYSNLVKVGIDVFQEILMQNGYLEYQEDASNYQINDDTICYYCGKRQKDHAKLNRMARADAVNMLEDDSSDSDKISVEQTGGKAHNVATDDDYMSDGEFSADSESDNESEDIQQVKPKKIHSIKSADRNADSKMSDTSTEYSPRHKVRLGIIHPHKFYPATFVSITGKSSEEKAELISEDKKRILDNVFNTIENKEGKFIKLILGSKVMNEGISMKNVGEVHILDVYFNLGKVDQVVGRAIRWCSHYKVMGENNVWPYVNVYKYVVTLDKNGVALSSEEELYKKAEQKYLLINKIERAMKERAFDCPLNMNGNMFNEEVEKYEKCSLHGDVKCPAICNYTKCDYKCDDPKLNFEYYDPNRRIYKAIAKGDLDYSTFTHGLAESEIDYAKTKIKNMYITSPVYTLKDIVDYVKMSYDEEKRDLFDEFFVFRALDSIIPITENDFNNFRDTIVDKNNTQGYLIYRDQYYIFQPFNQNEDVPLYYRVNNMQDINYELSLYNYLKNSEGYKRLKDDKKKGRIDKTGKLRQTEDVNVYNFDDTMEYYDSRDEYEIVGIIDKEFSRRKNKRADEIKDVFKIRPKLPKVLDKKRGTGIPSLKGAVCATSKSKEYLDQTAKKLGAVIKPEMTRIDVCETIEKQMLEKEKYSTDKDKNKLTYIRLPANHPKYPFPYNLEDRVKYLITKIRSEVKHAMDITTNKNTIKTGTDKGKPSYGIVIKKKPQLDEYADLFKRLGATQDKDNWMITLE